MSVKLKTFVEMAPAIRQHKKQGGLLRGLSTGWASIDEIFLLKKGMLNVFTGIPSAGKSSFLNHLMLNTIALHDWHWTVFSPESWPLESHFQELAEIWNGKPMFGLPGLDGMTETEMDETMQELSQNICFIEPPEDDLKLDTVMDGAKMGKDVWNSDSFLLDPWNELEHSRPRGMNESEYIGQNLTRLRNFGRKSEMAMNIVAHPTKLKKDDDGNWPIPTLYDISGSANWWNKPDGGVTIWRDYNATDGKVDIHSKKVRKKNLGQLGTNPLIWHRLTGMFLENRVANDVLQSHAVKLKKRK